MGFTLPPQHTGNGVASAASSITGTWSASTTANNLLVAVLVHDFNPGTYTGPNGWTQIGSTLSNLAGSEACYLSMWYAKNAAAQSTSVWSHTNTGGRSSIEMAEYKGGDPSNPFVLSGTNTGNSNNPNTGSVSVSANQLCVGVYGLTSSPAISQATFTENGTFSDLTQSKQLAGSSAVTAGFNDKVPGADGSQSGTVTCNFSDGWASMIAVFAPAAVVLPTTPPAQVFNTPIHPHQTRVPDPINLPPRVPTIAPAPSPAWPQIFSTPDLRQFDFGRGSFNLNLIRIDPSVPTFKTVEARIFQTEIPRPSPGSFSNSNGTVPSTDTTPRVTPVTLMQQEPPKSPSGGLFPLSNVPTVDKTPIITPVVFSKIQERSPFEGMFFSFRSGPDPVSTISPPTPANIFSAQSATPFAGSVLVASVGIDSTSTVPPAPPFVFVASEPPRPYPGATLIVNTLQVWWPYAPPAQVFMREERRPEPGQFIASSATPSVTPQVPTPPVVFFQQEPPRPYPGGTMIIGQFHWQFIIPIVSTTGNEPFIIVANKTAVAPTRPRSDIAESRPRAAIAKRIR